MTSVSGYVHCGSGHGEGREAAGHAWWLHGIPQQWHQAGMQQFRSMLGASITVLTPAFKIHIHRRLAPTRRIIPATLWTASSNGETRLPMFWMTESCSSSRPKTVTAPHWWLFCWRVRQQRESEWERTNYSPVLSLQVHHTAERQLWLLR